MNPPLRHGPGLDIAAVIMSVLVLVLIGGTALIGCPSQDETRRAPDDGAESKTGEADATEAPKPSV